MASTSVCCGSDNGVFPGQGPDARASLSAMGEEDRGFTVRDRRRVSQTPDELPEWKSPVTGTFAQVMGSRRGRDELIAWREQIRAEIRFLERFIPALIQRGNKQEADRQTGELEDLRRQLETSEPPLRGFPPPRSTGRGLGEWPACTLRRSR